MSHSPTDPKATANEQATPSGTKALDTKTYVRELKRLQIELAKLQEWVKQSGSRICVLFEGRDAAGKGGTIQRISQYLNPRICRIAALPKPNDRERTQWYFQRYVSHLPAGGEITLFDRSWYTRALVEHVMGFCTEKEYREFLVSCPEFERLLRRSGIILIKYWFSISDTEQERRFQKRVRAPLKRWKLSEMDLEARRHWVEFSQAKDDMFRHTDLDESPWYVVESDNKQQARLNCISHLLSLVPYADVLPEVQELPPRQADDGYKRPPHSEQRFVPSLW